MTQISDNRSRALTTTPSRVNVRAAPLSSEERKKLEPPKHRGFTSIPTPEVLEKLIAQAVSAFRRGIIWDRGSILNILV